MSEVVPDASALMAVLREEPGATEVEAVLDEAAISAVNLSEVQAKLVERGTPADQAWEWLTDLELHVLDFGIGQARDRRRSSLVHAGPWPLLRRPRLSCRARAVGAPAMTADRAWAALAVGIEIGTIR